MEFDLLLLFENKEGIGFKDQLNIQTYTSHESGCRMVAGFTNAQSVEQLVEYCDMK